MNLVKELNKNKLKLLEDAGVNVENREYSKEERRKLKILLWIIALKMEIWINLVINIKIF